MRSQEFIDYLLRLSDAKLVLMKDLLRITEEQQEVIDNEKVEMLDQLIQQKQSIMEKIDLLDKEFLDKYGLLKSQLGVEDLQEIDGQKLPEFKELKEKISEVVSFVEKIQQLDRENTQSLKRNMEKVKQNLKTIRTGKKAITGYNSVYKESHSIFMDKKK